MNTPLISIGMPVFNAAPYLAAAVEGVLNQSFENIELVITDNCSTDGSAEIAREYARRDPQRVRFLANHWNIGYSGNAHKATSLCTGDFILMHGADDVLMPGALRAYADLILASAAPDRLVLMADYEQGDSQGRSHIRWTLDAARFDLRQEKLDYVAPAKTTYLQGREILKACLPRLHTFGGVGSVAVARSLYQQVEGYLSQHWFNPDKFFMYKLLSLDPQVAWWHEPFYFYRVHESNQLALQRGTAVLRQLLDEYAYTFEFSPEFHAAFASRETLVQTFLEVDCLNAALREMAIGSRLQGFRHLAFALATYPEAAWRNPKTYAALTVWAGGPWLRPLAKALYQAIKSRHE